MLVCRTCGHENPDGFRFCGGCGAPLVPEAPVEVRKVVSVLFCDLTGSTALGDRLDAERLRGLLKNYYAELREIVERHGGTVEKFIGDAVMGVFGLPQLHEDDALRAVRAAEDMRAAVAALDLQVRIGVNTGEVVAGEGETLLTGDAVNVAARLEQAAQPGEILIGERTQELVSTVVRAELVEALVLKGKTEPVTAFRLLEVLPSAPAFTRRIDAPFVGRMKELEALTMAFARALDTQTCQLCTVVGPPGIGKSRLARECIAAAGDEARVLVGRCLSYGEGITYWPLAEIVRQVAGEDPHGVAQLISGEDGTLAGDRIAAAMGAANGATIPEEIFWGFRKLFEALARERPLIVVIDDIHWAEATLLDLLEYVTSFVADAPMLLLCLARPDLFELRPSWSNPRPNASLLPLEPLDEYEALSLVDRLVEERALSQEARTRVTDAAEGNPLFVEQLLAMQAETGNGELELPPTIQALLSARIDRLPPEERAVLERASVEGRMFHRGAIAMMLPEQARGTLGAQLMALVRKEFIRPDRALFPGDDGFRFGHVLIRDAAYATVSKQLRAVLHESFANWLERQAAARASEYEEIVAYHLEQAVRYHVELGILDGHVHELSLQAADGLARAGRRAFSRGDARSAGILLRRAASLPVQNHRSELLLDLGTALAETGDLEDAKTELAGAAEIAETEGRTEVAWRATLERAHVRMMIEPVQTADEIGAEVHEAIAFLEPLGDNAGLARAWRLLCQVHTLKGQGAAAYKAANRAIDYARSAGVEPEIAKCISSANSSMYFGPTPVQEAIQHAQALLTTFGTNRTIEGTALSTLCLFFGMAARFDEARDAATKARANAEELGQRQRLAVRCSNSSLVEMWAGNLEAAEHELRRAFELFAAMGADLGSTAVELAEVLHRLGRDEEALRLLETYSVPQWGIGSEMEMLWRSRRAKVLARLGSLPEATEIARSARELAAQTDFLNLHADVLVDEAEVMRIAGRSSDSIPLVEEALRLYQQKGNVVSAATARAELDELLATSRV